MRYAKKNNGKIVKAYELGANSEMEKILITEGTIRKAEDGSYTLFSQEAVNGQGEHAQSGDFFKVDEINGKHYPYPNNRIWFLKNHRHLNGDEYEQISIPVMIWERTDPMCEEIEYLLNSGRLIIDAEEKKHYYNAFIWGAMLSAADDAVVVLYSTARDEQGNISDVVFNFVDRKSFERDYDVLC